MFKPSGENPNIKILTSDVFSNVQNEKLKQYRLKWKQNPLEHVVDRFPIHMDIESTSVCNLKCPFCAGTYEKYTHGFMSMEMFSTIVDEGSSKGLYSIKLNFRGEPLLHPQIDEMVSYAKQKGIVDVFFNTNATRLSEDVGRRLIHAGLDRLIISFEGYEKDLYEKNRVGADFETVVNNIRKFHRLRREFKSATPLLRMQTVDINPVTDYLERYKKFWEKYADEITCIDLRNETIDYSFVESVRWECPYPWRRLCITWDGHVYTCPFVNRASDKYEWQGLGTVGDLCIEDMWKGPEMQMIREMHEGRASHIIEPCKYCSYRGTEILKRLLTDKR